MRSREDVMQVWEDARVVSVDQEFRRSSQRELNKPLADIPQDRLGTNIITGETKDGGAK